MWEEVPNQEEITIRISLLQLLDQFFKDLNPRKIVRASEKTENIKQLNCVNCVIVEKLSWIKTTINKNKN